MVISSPRTSRYSPVAVLRPRPGDHLGLEGEHLVPGDDLVVPAESLSSMLFRYTTTSSRPRRSNTPSGSVDTSNSSPRDAYIVILNEDIWM